MTRNKLRVAGLFAGVGGIELGLHRAGHVPVLFVEVDDAAQQILVRRFPGVVVLDDVRELHVLPRVDLVTAGFPCQDLSQAGRTAGIRGARSGLIAELFRLVRHRPPPPMLLLENVPNMLSLRGGEAMDYLTGELESLGYVWAYRVVDTRAFGLPQRRRRVFLLACRDRDPRDVLLVDDAGEPPVDHPWADKIREVPDGVACGFYWTEGERGLGWAVDAVPTFKGGSGLGIPSPPAILLPDGEIGTPEIRDAERLQGFPTNWTAPAERLGVRWRLVGNAVSVPVARWIGGRLTAPGTYDPSADRRLEPGERWPTAAWSLGDGVYRSNASAWPRRRYRHLLDFLRYPLKPLSLRAVRGFLARAERGSLRFPAGFLEAVIAYRRRLERS